MKYFLIDVVITHDLLLERLRSNKVFNALIQNFFKTDRDL